MLMSMWILRCHFTNKSVAGAPSGSGGTTLLLYFAFALVHDSRGIKIVNFTISAHTISRHADGISWYSVPPSAGPLLPLGAPYSIKSYSLSHRWTPAVFCTDNEYENMGRQKQHSFGLLELL